MGNLAAVNGTRLYFELLGNGRRLVLLHGFTLDLRMWDQQIDPFGQRFQVMRYDQRGFGRSDLPGPEAFSPIDDLASLLDYLELESIHLVGQSRGGAVAIDFALQHPDRMQSLVLIDTVLGGFSWSLESAARDGLVWEEAARGGVAAGKESWLTHPIFAPALANPSAAARLMEIINDYSGWHFVNESPELYLDPPAADRLGEIKVPTLVLIGDLDLPDFQTIAEVVANSVAHASLVRIPGAGHMSNMEAPALVNDAMLAFLDRQ